MNKIFVAFASGVVLGLLFAPAKGKDTRKKIADIGNDCKEGWNKFTDRIADKIDNLRDGVDQAAYNAVEKIEGVQFDTVSRSL